jgi:energy-coupling factor transport system permease protein
MTLVAPLVPDPGAPLARASPVAKLGAAALVMAVLFVSVDAVTATLVLAAELAAVPFTGLSPTLLLRRCWPLALAAVSIGLVNALLPAEHSGEMLARLGPIGLSTGSTLAGIGLALRLAGIGFVGVLAIASSDPTELADGLMQHLRLSPRFTVGALAAVRLLPILAAEWQMIRLARRARGVDAGRSPLSGLNLFGRQLLALLVGAIRRGTRMAMAMEARGFGALPCRTLARERPIRAGDWALIAAAAGVGLAACAISMALGTWRFLLG